MDLLTIILLLSISSACGSVFSAVMYSRTSKAARKKVEEKTIKVTLREENGKETLIVYDNTGEVIESFDPKNIEYEAIYQRLCKL